MESEEHNGRYTIVRNLPSVVQNDDHSFNVSARRSFDQFMYDPKRTDQQPAITFCFHTALAFTLKRSRAKSARLCSVSFIG